jgi:CRP-like cAMP-binding protein
MLSELTRLEPFQTYGMSELRLLAAHTRILDVPAGRWLLRRGRRLTGHHYLLRGALLTCSPDGVLEAGDPAARRPICPGPAALKTLSDCRLLLISPAGLELAAMRLQPGLVTVTETEACWQTRFLESHLMTRLRPAAWQRVLSRLKPEYLQAADWVLREGAPADHCCILAAGEAAVIREAQGSGSTGTGEVVALLSPGDLFGEDALIVGGRRNASVRMREAGVVMRLDAAEFSRFLVEVLNEGGVHPPAAATEDRRLLRITSASRLRERLASLDPGASYLVSSPASPVLALTLFLLRKRGIRAWAAPR